MTRSTDRAHRAADTQKLPPSADLERARRLILISLGFWLLIGVLSTGVHAGIA
jgi:hypothetical protein